MTLPHIASRQRTSWPAPQSFVSKDTVRAQVSAESRRQTADSLGQDFVSALGSLPKGTEALLEFKICVTGLKMCSRSTSLSF